MDVLAYYRVSTDEQGRTGHGLDAQRAAISKAAEARGWRVVAEEVDDGYSGKSLDRPGVQRALARLENGGPKVLVVSKLDRLSRSALDFLTVVQRATGNGWAIVVLDLDLDMTTPFGKFTATVMAGVAELERELIAQRTRDALAAAKANGKRLGRPVETDEDTRRAIVAMREDGLSLHAIAVKLTADGVPTARGGQWWPATVRRVLRGVELDRVAGTATP
jgi:DNA invertase Pin-like site-specific DNA recombinase